MEIKKILKEFNDQAKATRLEQEGAAAYSVSVEDSGSDEAKEGFVQVKNVVTNTIALSLEDSETNDFNKAQLKAAEFGAAMGINPNNVLERDLSVAASSDVISHMDLGIEDAAEVSMEAFDPEAVASAAKFSFGFNLLASKQDEFGETLFPTIVIDPKIAAAEVTANIEMLTEEILRTENTSDKARMKKTSLIKAMVNPNGGLADDRNAVVPVLRATNYDVLLAPQAFVSSVSGEEIETAPLVIGKEINLLAISQTDAALAKGVMDNTDALNSRIVLKDIYYELKSDDGTTVTTEVFKFNVSAFPYNNFTHSQQGHSKDIALSFSTEAFSFVTGETTTFDGSESVVLASVAANHTVTYKVVLHGNGNTENGEIAVFQSSVEIIEIKDAGGNVLPATNATYVAIKDSIGSTLKIVGYTVEAYTTNSNMRNIGQLVTVDTITQRYVVPVRSGIAVQKPIGSRAEGDNDAAWLKAQVSTAGIKTSLAAVKTLVDYTDSLRTAVENGVDITENRLSGVGRHFVTPYYNSSSIDLTATVDSLKSSERDDDIRLALVGKIKNAVLAMISESQYGITMNAMYPGSNMPITAVVATSGTLAGYLGDAAEIKVGKNVQVKVVSTANPLMRNRMIITFITTGADRNVKPNVLNFGQMFWSPEVSAEMPFHRNGRTVRVLATQPRYLHVVNLPVMTDFTVTGLNTVIGKVTQNTATV